MAINTNSDTLIALGLNGSQARIYLALVDNGICSVREVSKIAQLSRPDTYRTIVALEDKGLIERVITSPTKYKPLALREALTILMERKKKEVKELNQKVESFYEQYREKEVRHSSQDASHQFILISEGEALSHKLRKMDENAQKSICVMLSQKKLLPWLLYDETINQALARGINVKILTEKNSGLTVPKDLVEFERNQTFEIRYSKIPITVCFRIYDSKEVLLTTVTMSDAKESTAVWSNNSSFLELAQTYFDTAWLAAVDACTIN